MYPFAERTARWARRGSRFAREVRASREPRFAREPRASREPTMRPRASRKPRFAQNGVRLGGIFDMTHARVSKMMPNRGGYVAPHA